MKLIVSLALAAAVGFTVTFSVLTAQVVEQPAAAPVTCDALYCNVG